MARRHMAASGELRVRGGCGARLRPPGQRERVGHTQRRRSVAARVRTSSWSQDSHQDLLMAAETEPTEAGEGHSVGGPQPRRPLGPGVPASPRTC